MRRCMVRKYARHIPCLSHHVSGVPGWGEAVSPNRCWAAKGNFAWLFAKAKRHASCLSRTPEVNCFNNVLLFQTSFNWPYLSKLRSCESSDCDSGAFASPDQQA